MPSWGEALAGKGGQQGCASCTEMPVEESAPCCRHSLTMPSSRGHSSLPGFPAVLCWTSTAVESCAFPLPFSRATEGPMQAAQMEEVKDQRPKGSRQQYTHWCIYVQLHPGWCHTVVSAKVPTDPQLELPPFSSSNKSGATSTWLRG